MINKFSILLIFIFMIVVSRILKLVILSFWIVLKFSGRYGLPILSLIKCSRKL